MQIELEELKEKIYYLIETDKEFGLKLFKYILSLYGDELVTKSYLDESLFKLSKEFDEKLARQSKEFDEKLARQSKEFDEKLLKLRQDLSKEFDEKLLKLRQDLSKEFDEKLARQSKEFDEKLARQSKEFDEKLLKLRQDLSNEFNETIQKFDKKFEEKIKSLFDRIGVIGGRWGLDAEITIKKLFEEIKSSWGGEVKKWNKKVKLTTPEGIVIDKSYEIDIIAKDGTEKLIEVKASCNKDSMERFSEACDYYIATEGGHKIIEKILVTFFVYEDAIQIANLKGIKIISP